MASFVYNVSKLDLWRGTRSWSAATIGVMLTTSAYIPDPDHLVVNDGVSAANSRPGSNELFTIGYARQLLAGKSSTIDSVNNVAFLDANDAVWTGIGAGETFTGVVLYVDSTTDVSRQLFAYIDLTSILNSVDLTIAWSVGGIVSL